MCGRMEGRSVVERRELEIVKQALCRILQEENPLPPDEQQAREEELSKRLGFDGSSSPSRDLESRDLAIISRLLNQVHLLERDNCDDASNKAVTSEVGSSYNGPVADDKHVVETMVQVANAAAEAAKSAAASSGKILEITETVLSNPQTTTSHQLTRSESKSKGRKAGKEDVSRSTSLSDKNLVKKLGRQNTITHLVLGFMIVSTAIWRFKLLNMILGVRKSFSNPLQTLGDMVADSFKGGSSKEERTPPKKLHKSRGVLPSILGGEEREVTVEKTERSTTIDDFKVGDAFTASLENILNVGKANHDSDKEESTN